MAILSRMVKGSFPEKVAFEQRPERRELLREEPQAWLTSKSYLDLASCHQVGLLPVTGMGDHPSQHALCWGDQAADPPPEYPCTGEPTHLSQ